MKRILFFILSLGAFLNAYSQAPLIPSVRCSLTVVNTFSDPYSVTGKTVDFSSNWDATSIVAGDSLYLMDGNELRVYRVATISSASGTNFTMTIDDINNSGNIPVTGVYGAFFRGTTNYEFPNWVAGVSEQLNMAIQNRFVQRLDALIAGGSNVDYVTTDSFTTYTNGASFSSIPLNKVIWRTTTGSKYEKTSATVVTQRSVDNGLLAQTIATTNNDTLLFNARLNNRVLLNTGNVANCYVLNPLYYVNNNVGETFVIGIQAGTSAVTVNWGNIFGVYTGTTFTTMPTTTVPALSVMNFVFRVITTSAETVNFQYVDGGAKANITTGVLDTATANRTVPMGGFDLTFTGADDITLQNTGNTYLNATGEIILGNGSGTNLPTTNSDHLGMDLGYDGAGTLVGSQKNAKRSLSGSSDPTNGSTVAWYVGQLYTNTTSGDIFVATTASSNPDLSGTSSIWVKVSDTGGGITTGDKGDIDVVDASNDWRIDTGAVSWLKLAQAVKDSIGVDKTFANTNLTATGARTHSGAGNTLTFSGWGKLTTDFSQTGTKPVAYDFGGASTSTVAGLDTVFGVRIRPILTGINASNVYSAFQIEPVISGTFGSFSSLFSVKPSSLTYPVFSVRGNGTIGTAEARIRFGTNINDALLLQCSGTNAIVGHGQTTGILQLKLGSNIYFNIDNSNDISISATSNNTSSATSTATQVGSRKLNFLNALWDGAAARGGQYLFLSEASTSTNLLANFRLKYTDGAGASGTLLDISSITGKWTISRPTGGSTSTPNELLELNGTSSFLPPRGTTAQRPSSPTAGAERYNSTIGLPEWFDGTNWNSYGVSGSSIQTASSGATTVVTAAPTKVDIKVIVAQVTGSGTVVNLPALSVIPAGKEVTVKFQGIDAGQTATVGVNGGGVNIDSGTSVSFSDTDDYASVTFWHNGTQYFIK